MHWQKQFWTAAQTTYIYINIDRKMKLVHILYKNPCISLLLEKERVAICVKCLDEHIWWKEIKHTALNKVNPYHRVLTNYFKQTFCKFQTLNRYMKKMRQNKKIRRTQTTNLTLSCSRTNCVTHTHFSNTTIKSNFAKGTKIFQNM